MSGAERPMREALELAREVEGTTSPNPAVGAVVVRAGEVVGRGRTQPWGGAHAEVGALQDAGAAARGSDLYVTLEPCSHHGRTPPCTEAIIRAGIARVYVGAGDPNPRVDGGGVAQLRAAGVDVVEGVLADEAAALNEAFARWVVSGRPFVTLKLATTLDGRIAAADGSSQWITGPAARREVHRMRALSDAVMVGIGTALADDPRLSAREAPAPGGQPVRVIVDSRLRLPTSAKVLAPLAQARRQPATIVATAIDEARRRDALAAAGAEVVALPGAEGKVALDALLVHLGSLPDRPLTSVLVEGGGQLAASLLREGLVDKVVWYIAPALMGGDGLPALAALGVRHPSEARRLERLTSRSVGTDTVISGYLPRRGPSGQPPGTRGG